MIVQPGRHALRSFVRVVGLSLLTATALLNAGCASVYTSAKNLYFEASLAVDEATECYQDQRMANAAWERARAECAPTSHTHDYMHGFKAGFVNYLKYGGAGTPPYLPPQRYWKTRFRSPEGHQAVEAWYAGFRHGTQAAKESGSRQWQTVPSSGMPVSPAGFSPLPTGPPNPRLPPFLPPGIPPGIPPGPFPAAPPHLPSGPTGPLVPGSDAAPTELLPLPRPLSGDPAFGTFGWALPLDPRFAGSSSLVRAVATTKDGGWSTRNSPAFRPAATAHFAPRQWEMAPFSLRPDEANADRKSAP